MFHMFDIFKKLFPAGVSLLILQAQAQVAPVLVATNVTFRAMAANLNGNVQSYQPFALRIFQGLKPDVVAIQEFNYSNNTQTAFRQMIDTAFGTNYVYFRENYTANGNIPNGIISRFPIIASGSWADTLQSQPNRGFAWAQLDLPGTNDLYVVSVHLLSGAGPTARASESANLKTLIQSNFPSNALIIVAGDCNISSTSEGALATFKTFLSDAPIPTDALSGGDPDTNAGRNERYDYVFPSFSLESNRVATVIGTQTFSNGLVFDSRVYSPLNDVAPIQMIDSSNAQHMAVMKSFKINYTITNFVTVPSPTLTLNSTNIIRWQGVSNVTYSVQTSTNLPAFVTVGTATSTTTNLSFTNQSSGTWQRFFRVVYP